MKIKFAYLPAILLTGLLMGCKPSTPPVDGTPAKDTNVVSTATDPATNQVVISRLGAGESGSFTTPSEPYGIAVDPINQRIYVSQPNLNEVLVYNLKSPYKLLGTIK